MSEQLPELPDDVETLKGMVRTYHGRALRAEERIRQLVRSLFGRKSEKIDPEEEKQGRLFNEAEAQVIPADASPEKEKGKKTKVKGGRTRRRRNKTASFPPDWPRYDVLHDVEEPNKKCKCGAERSRIGEDVTEKLQIVPQQVVVERHIRPKYACKSCEGSEGKGLAQAPMPPAIIPKSIATPSLLAYLFTAKFADGIPFYRHQGIFQRFGFELGRSTMGEWAIKTADKCERLIELLRQELASGPLIHIDETTLQVLREPGRRNVASSYMWVFRGGTPDKPVVLYMYRATRSAGFLTEMLPGYGGVILTDGFASYVKIVQLIGAVHAGCWAHVRRKFHDAMKDGSENAKVALGMIGKLYEFEGKWRDQDITGKELLDHRRLHSAPVTGNLREWLDDMSVKVVPSSLLGKAIGYALGEWAKLMVFLKYAFVPLDNNPVENIVRPFAVGRKNWLFSGSPLGAQASAVLYTLVENAKANRIDPYWYLRCLFERLPTAQTDDELRALLPQQIDRMCLEGFHDTS